MSSKDRAAPAAELERALARILTSDAFHGALRQQAFLRFVVAETLAGRGGDIKETLIATHVYEKRADYDPRIDSTVRVEASKLRARLASYYESEGASDAMRIAIPKGTYAPTWEATPAPPKQSIPWKRVLSIAAGASAIFGVIWYGLKPSAIDPSKFRIDRLTESGALSATPSAGGDFVVYASDRSGEVLNLWRQPLQGGPPVRLTRSTHSHTDPSVSADGSTAIFRSEENGGQLALVAVGGGQPRLLKDTAGGRDPRFSPRGSRVVFWSPRDQETNDYGRVFLIDTAEAYGYAAVRLFGDFAHAARPIWSSGGEHVLALGTWHSEVPEKEFDAWVVALAGRHSKDAPVKTGLFQTLRAGGYYRNLNERAAIEVGEWRDGWLYFTAPGGEVMDLYRIRLSEADGRVSGAPQRLTFGAGSVKTPRLAPDGQIVFARTDVSYDLHSLDESGALTRHTSETGLSFRAAIDPAGRSAVWEKRPPGSDGQIWLFDIFSSERWKLGWGDDHVYSHAILSPDGKRAAYRHTEPGLQPIYAQARGDSRATRICANCGTPADWTTDGSRILYVTGGQPALIGALKIDSGEIADFLKHPSYNLYGPRARLDKTGDGWVVFYADNSPQTRQIYLAPVKKFQAAGLREWIPLTDGAGWDQSPAWAEDGKSIYYVARHGSSACIMSTSIDNLRQIREVRHFHSVRQTLMRSLTNRGADALWAAGGRLFFMLDNRTSDLWRINTLVASR